MIDLTALTDAELGAHLLAVSAELDSRNRARVTEARLAAAVRSAEEQGLPAAEIDAAIQRVTETRRGSEVRPPTGSTPTTRPTTTSRST